MYYLVIVDAYGDIDVTLITKQQYKELEHLTTDEIIDKMEDFTKLYFGVARADVIWCGTQCKQPKFTTIRYKPVPKR